MKLPVPDKYSPKGYTKIDVDSEDLEFLVRGTLSINTLYPGTDSEKRTVNFRPYNNGQYRPLSRHLTDAPKGMEVDHIDRNPLNNKRSNLRIVTRQENHFNKKHIPASGYRGVSCTPSGGSAARLSYKHLTYTITGAKTPKEAYDRFCELYEYLNHKPLIERID